MEALNKLQEFIKNLDEKDLLRYILIFLASLFLIMGLLVYIHYRRVRNYTNRLETVNKERAKTARILSDYKLVIQQKAKVEEILEQRQDFYIDQEWNNILNKLNFTKYQTEAPQKRDGEKISNKTEKILKTRLDGITTKQLVNLLQEIAEEQRLYPKDITIKKTPKAKTIDVDLEIATLEPTPTE